MKNRRWMVVWAVVLFGLVLGVLAEAVRAEVVILQPGPEGADTYGYVQNGAAVDTNFGNATSLAASATNNYQYQSFLRFDLSSLPAGVHVQHADLRLFNYMIDWANRGDSNVGVYRVLESWIEGNGGVDNDPPGELTWNNRPDIDSVSYDTLLFEGAPEVGATRVDFYPDEWRTWNVTDLVSAWYTAAVPNYGLALSAIDGQTFPRFHSSDFSTTGFQPMLIITYVPEPSTAVLALIALTACLSFARKARR